MLISFCGSIRLRLGMHNLRGMRGTQVSLKNTRVSLKSTLVSQNGTQVSLINSSPVSLTVSIYIPANSHALCVSLTPADLLCIISLLLITISKALKCIVSVCIVSVQRSSEYRRSFSATYGSLWEIFGSGPGDFRKSWSQRIKNLTRLTQKKLAGIHSCWGLFMPRMPHMFCSCLARLPPMPRMFCSCLAVVCLAGSHIVYTLCGFKLRSESSICLPALLMLILSMLFRFNRETID